MKVVLATRQSKLALAQARAYAATLVALHPGLSVEELHVVTSGDRFQDRPLQAIGGKGLFIKEIEEALLERRADLAVHSIKDVPAQIAQGLTIAAIPAREDPRDVLLTRDGGGLDALAPGSLVGTSSLRRATQLKARRGDLKLVPLRGNVDTRLRKLDEGQVQAIVLARAGLARLGLVGRAGQILPAELMLPAVGQGALGIECRAGDSRVIDLLAPTDDPDTHLCVTAERAFLGAVGGSCQLPVAGYCQLPAGELWIRAMLADEDGSRARFGERRASSPSDRREAWQLAERMGRQLGEELARR